MWKPISQTGSVRQNANNNFSATVPYDMEQQKKEMKEFLDDLTTRDQRMMFAVITMVITADSKEQLENDTEALLTTAKKTSLPVCNTEISAGRWTQYGNAVWNKKD